MPEHFVNSACHGLERNGQKPSSPCSHGGTRCRKGNLKDEISSQRAKFIGTHDIEFTKDREVMCPHAYLSDFISSSGLTVSVSFLIHCRCSKDLSVVSRSSDIL